MVIKQKQFIALLKKWSDVMMENKDYLIEIDSVVGDADLGLTMSEGFLAAYQAVQNNVETDIGKLAYYAGKAMSTAVPSTMGTLMAQGFMAAGKALRGADELAEDGIAVFFEEFFNGVQKLGGAKTGEKTFLDGMTTSLKLLRDGAENGTPLNETAHLVIPAAESDLQNTTTMVAKHGRAAIRGEDSRSLLDPWAAVAKILLCTFAEFVFNLD